MKNKKGAALLLALFTLLFASLLVVGFLQITTSDLQIMHNHYLKNKALYTAEAGVEYAFSRIRTRNANFSRTMTFPVGSGNSYNVTYTRSSGKIVSVGSLSSGERVSLEVKVSVKGSSAPFKVKVIYWREL